MVEVVRIVVPAHLGQSSHGLLAGEVLHAGGLLQRPLPCGDLRAAPARDADAARPNGHLVCLPAPGAVPSRTERAVGLQVRLPYDVRKIRQRLPLTRSIRNVGPHNHDSGWTANPRSCGSMRECRLPARRSTIDLVIAIVPRKKAVGNAVEDPGDCRNSGSRGGRDRGGRPALQRRRWDWRWDLLTGHDRAASHACYGSRRSPRSGRGCHRRASTPSRSGRWRRGMNRKPVPALDRGRSLPRGDPMDRKRGPVVSRTLLVIIGGPIALFCSFVLAFASDACGLSGGGNWACCPTTRWTG